MEVEIRIEKSSDFLIISQINNLAFERVGESKLVEELRKSEAFIPDLSLIAIVEDQIVGHILISKIKIIDANKNEFESLSLAPMAILPAFQKKGIGSKLIKMGLEKAQALNYKSIFVLGHEHYYPKFGFKPAINWNIKPPFVVPANVFMALELVHDGLQGITGTVQYPDAYNVL